jgi:hypothetical protein
MLCMPPACWTVQGEVRGHRQQVETYLSAHLGTVPKSVGLPGTGLRLLQAAAAAPLHGPLDLVRLALQPLAASSLNPFLSAESAARLQQAARLWLQLCVLEDRLGRLVGLAADPSATSHLIQVRCSVSSSRLVRTFACLQLRYTAVHCHARSPHLRQPPSASAPGHCLLP